MLRHLVKAIRARWPKVEIVIRGDSHYARPEAMSWLERNRVRYVFGLAGLLDRVAALAEDTAVRRAEEDADKVRRFHDFRYAQAPPLPREGARQRHALCRDQSHRHAPLALRGPLLRPWPLRGLVAAFLSGIGSSVC